MFFYVNGHRVVMSLAPCGLPVAVRVVGQAGLSLNKNLVQMFSCHNCFISIYHSCIRYSSKIT